MEEDDSKHQGAGVERPTDAPDDEPATKPLSTKGSFGTAVGAVMLGFEQALRSEPPAEILAAEHVPERGQSGKEGGVIIEFPEPVTGTSAAPARPGAAEAGNVVEEEVAAADDERGHGQGKEHRYVHHDSLRLHGVDTNDD